MQLRGHLSMWVNLDHSLWLLICRVAPYLDWTKGNSYDPHGRNGVPSAVPMPWKILIVDYQILVVSLQNKLSSKKVQVDWISKSKSNFIVKA